MLLAIAVILLGIGGALAWLTPHTATRRTVDVAAGVLAIIAIILAVVALLVPAVA